MQCQAVALQSSLEGRPGAPGHLRLSRASGDPVGSSSASLGASGGHGSGNGVGLRHRGLGHASDCLACTRRLAVLLVGGEVEGDEEDEVRADGDDAGERSELLSGALAHGGQRGEVGRAEVGVGRKVDEAYRVSSVQFVRVEEGWNNIPMSMMNWTIWRRVTHSFHQQRMPRALWK
jgi:hypothetical protein